MSTVYTVVGKRVDFGKGMIEHSDGLLSFGLPCLVTLGKVSGFGYLQNILSDVLTFLGEY